MANWLLEFSVHFFTLPFCSGSHGKHITVNYLLKTPVVNPSYSSGCNCLAEISPIISTR
eukprot:c14544_g1_i1 orf=3-176(-)